MSRLTRLLPSALLFAFATIAFIFSLLAINSDTWSVRSNYNISANDFDFFTPIYTITRSPFSVCNALAIVVNVTTTTTSSATASPTATDESTSSATSDASPATATMYNVSCTRYRPYGFDQTSCELAIATQNDDAPNIGDARLCQQIHYAGNFAITSTVFITAGLFLVASMLSLAYLSISSEPYRRDSAVPESNEPEQPVEQTTKEASSSITGGASKSHKKQHVHRRRRRSALAPYINLLLILFLLVGSFAAGISQFYATLGLVQSAPNNAAFAASSGVGSDIKLKGNHGPWFAGKALTFYMTMSWGFAFLTALLASRAWPLPRGDIGL